MSSEYIPVYVTRSHSGQTGAFMLSLRLFLFTFTLIWLNVVGWSLFGLYQLVSQVISHV